MKIYCVWLFCLVGVVCGQNLTVENNRKTAVINFSDKALSVPEQIEFQRQTNYKFYELVDPKGINIRAVPLDNIAVTDISVLQNGFRLNANLTNSLEYGKIYLLKISNAKSNGKELPVMRLELNAEPQIKAFNDPRNRMRVESNVELSDTNINVTETSLQISKDKTRLEIASQPVLIETQKVTPTQINIKFKKELSEARNHYFRVDLIADDGTPLRTKGKVYVPGLPAPNPNPAIDVKLSTEFGGNLKPQFNLSGILKKSFAKSENDVFHFEPILNIDIGLGVTKSKNSIALELPIIKYSYDLPRSAGCRINKIPTLKDSFSDLDDHPQMTVGKSDSVPLPCYAEWKKRNPFSLYSLDFQAGQKFETDKKFSRLNALGTVRLDFNFDRWQHSIANQRSYLEEDLKNTPYRNNVKDILIQSGFTLTPRLGIEFGRKLTAETVVNKAGTIRFVVPAAPIFRTYAGFTNIFEWNWFLPLKLTINQDLFYLAYPETSGEFKVNTLNFRKIQGFHPFGKASLDIAFDNAKRYSFNITYENGRAAPNFEYLNTIKTGFRVLY